MTIHLVHHIGDDLAPVLRLLWALHERGNQLMTGQAELADEIKAVSTALDTVQTEVKNLVTQVADLKNRVANGLDAEALKAGLDGVLAKAQSIAALAPVVNPAPAPAAAA